MHTLTHTNTHTQMVQLTQLSISSQLDHTQNSFFKDPFLQIFCDFHKSFATFVNLLQLLFIIQLLFYLFFFLLKQSFHFRTNYYFSFIKKTHPHLLYFSYLKQHILFFQQKMYLFYIFFNENIHSTFHIQFFSFLFIFNSFVKKPYLF